MNDNPNYEPLERYNEIWVELPAAPTIARGNSAVKATIGVRIDTSDGGVTVVVIAKDPWGNPHTIDKRFYTDMQLEVELLGIRTMLSLVTGKDF